MKRFFEDYGTAIFYFGFVITCFVLLFTMSIKDNNINEQVYNNIMNGEYEFVDNIITQYNSKYSHKTLYKIMYKDSESIKEIDLDIQQYYDIIEKYKEKK